MLQTNRRHKFWRAPLPKLPWQRNALVLGTGVVGFMGLAGINILADEIGTNIKSATEWPRSTWAAAEKKRARLHEADYNGYKLKALESNCNYRKALVEGSLLRGLVLAAGMGLFVIAAFSPRIHTKMHTKISARVGYVGKRLALAGGFVAVSHFTHNDLRLHYSDYCDAKKNLRASTILKTPTSPS